MIKIMWMKIENWQSKYWNFEILDLQLDESWVDIRAKNFICIFIRKKNTVLKIK